MKTLLAILRQLRHPRRMLQEICATDHQGSDPESTPIGDTDEEEEDPTWVAHRQPMKPHSCNLGCLAVGVGVLGLLITTILSLMLVL